MPNFWDNISQNNKPYNVGYNQNQNPNLRQFIAQNQGKTLDQMLNEYNLNVTEDDIKRVLPQAKQILSLLGLKI